MPQFQFDTSGEVRVYTNVGEPGGARKRDYRWRDLSPFTQGYVEAVLRDACADLVIADHKAPLGERYPAFSDLAPETLARIMEDCERRCDRKRTTFASNSECSGQGADFWSARQRGHVGSAPPLTPYLGDDGKVYLRESIR